MTLGIETSCDDTGVCVLRGQREELASRIAGQNADHAPFGGVVPERASRRHQEVLLPLLQEVFAEAGVNNPARELDLIAVTAGPGLMGSLLTGVMCAKGLAQAWELPLIGVNHLEGHIFANVTAFPELTPPFLSLIASGGHTELVLVRALGDYRVLGRTRDDAVGEAYDKVAKLLDLDYPGGPEVDRLAGSGDPGSFAFPVPMKNSDEIAFSFSGLKTAVLWVVRACRQAGADLPGADICAAFQHAAVSALLAKIRLAARRTGVSRVAVSGGVAANSELRRRMALLDDLETYLPPRGLCTDNATMIAAAGYSAWRRGVRSDLSLAPDPSLPLPLL
ncbi:MAG: tRNA (adenosine(37)-N6)-threonylcarbamoyltransferase complex transferase subunit TsaD [Synergistales bacterium]|nr:tRNA (adenosine(37)-N6)-threonylcarbamoyltransferase complex transferase subunit TsaD [Synergistales bacterium]